MQKANFKTHKGSVNTHKDTKTDRNIKIYMKTDFSTSHVQPHNYAHTSVILVGPVKGINLS